VLLASAVLALLMWQWRPLGEVVWEPTAPWARTVWWAMYALGVLLLLAATFAIRFTSAGC